MLKKIAIVLISLTFISSTSYAQTSTSTTGKFTFLNKGDSAPFDGTLFNPAAVAKILTEKKMAEKQCNLRVKHQKELLDAKCNRDTELLQSELKIEKHKNNLIVQAQREEIETLRNLAKGTDNTLWAVIGFGIGTVTSIAIFFAAVEVTR
jgi:hypothetical protein